ncbi:MAG: YggT family protein [Candidatus Binataceae bacterium]
MYANTIIFIAQTLDTLLTIYFWIVIVAALMTWIEPNPYNQIVRFIYSVTEPVLDWIREHIPVMFGGIDFSPIVVIIAIEFAQRVLIQSAVTALLGGGFG